MFKVLFQNLTNIGLFSKNPWLMLLGHFFRKMMKICPKKKLVWSLAVTFNRLESELMGLYLTRLMM